MVCLIKKAAGLLLDSAAPEACAVCGRSMIYGSPEPGLPVCPECFSELADEEIRVRCGQSLFCKKCGKPLVSEDGICTRCRDRGYSFERAESVFFYSDNAKTLLLAYKMKNIKSLSRYYAGVFRRYYFEKYPDCIVVPVPFRPSSLKKRGWDQIETITVLMQKKYGIPVCKCLVRRDGPAQKTLDYESRLRNLDGKIRLESRAGIPGSVLLVDDVFTTGATLDHCASVLKKGGVKRVFCLTAAMDI